MTEGDRNPADRSLIRVHAWIIVLVTMITMGVAAAVVLSQPSEYEAEAEVELSATRTRGAPIPPNMATERRVALSGFDAFALRLRFLALRVALGDLLLYLVLGGGVLFV